MNVDTSVWCGASEFELYYHWVSTNGLINKPHALRYAFIDICAGANHSVYKLLLHKFLDNNLLDIDQKYLLLQSKRFHTVNFSTRIIGNNINDIKFLNMPTMSHICIFH